MSMRLSLDEAAAQLNEDAIIDYAPLDLRRQLVNPVRVTAATILSIVKNNNYDWFERALTLLEYVHNIYPSVLPEEYDRIITDIKSDIVLYSFMCDATIKKRKFQKTLRRMFNPLKYGSLDEADYHYKVYQNLLKTTTTHHHEDIIHHAGLESSSSMVLSSLVHYLAEVESVLSPPLGLDQETSASSDAPVVNTSRVDEDDEVSTTVFSSSPSTSDNDSLSPQRLT